MKRLLATSLLSLSLLAGCESLQWKQDTSAKTIQEEWMQAEIFCGMGKPTGGFVTETEWQKFVDEEVTTRFPDGLTVFSGNGQWKGASGKVEREPSHMIILLYQPAAEPLVRQVAAAYGKRFGQEAVLLVRTKANVEFVSGSASK